MAGLSLSLNALRLGFFLSYFAAAASIVVIRFLLFCIGTKIRAGAVDAVCIRREHFSAVRNGGIAKKVVADEGCVRLSKQHSIQSYM